MPSSATPTASPGNGRSRPPSFRRLFAQFALVSLAAAVAIALVAAYLIGRAATREAVRDARALTKVVGTTIVQPNLTPGVLSGDAAAAARFDRLIRSRVVGDPIVRVKLWDRTGRVVYSDARGLVGARFALEDEEAAAFSRNRVEAGVSDLRRPENRYERSAAKLLEVYMPLRTSDGKVLLFEAYMRYRDITKGGRQVWYAFAPALVGAVVLLWAAFMPLALSLARRLGREHAMRETLLLQALYASDAERRRIAADLHDGVVQDLAGTSLSLSAAAQRAETAPRADLGEALRAGEATTRAATRQLRSLLVEIYPPNLVETGVAAALEDLAATISSRGTVTTVTASPVRVDEEAEQLVFRTAQEALRNVVDHAHAATANVAFGAADGGIELRVEDDGRGFDVASLEAMQAHGHLGLRLLADRARDAGGALIVDSAPGSGTKVRLWLPVT